MSHAPIGYSLQLGRGSVIVRLTGITTVSNFRVADLAVDRHEENYLVLFTYNNIGKMPKSKD